MSFSSNYIRLRVLLYIFLVLFYTIEILYEDFSGDQLNQVQFEMRQGFGYALLSLSCAGLACCGARLDKSILLCDSALFAITIGRCLLVAFAGFNGEALFFALNIIMIFVFPAFDFYSRLEDTRSMHFQSIDYGDKLGGSNENISQGGIELKSVPLTDELIYDGFRIRIEKLPEVSSVVNNLPWSTFTSIEHRIDSSSCHIYTAFWNDRPVILKLIKADRISSPVAVAEFETEASILSRLRHPHIVRFLGSGYQPRRFLVLELLDGGSLSHALGVRVDKDQRSWRKNFSYLEALKLARSLASALHYLHNQWNENVCVIHRDLKPDNIGFTSDGNIKLFDFGLCSVVKRMQSRGEIYAMTGNTGTLRYMAPEVALGKEYNQSVDAYSFGVILWQMVKGKVPFSGLGRRTYMENVVAGGERPKLDRRWPQGFCTLLQKCWCEDKLIRPSFAEVVVDLDQLILAEESSTKNKIVNVFKSTFLPNPETVAKIQPYVLAISFVFLVVSIIVCLASRSEITGISMTIIAAVIFYIIAIMCAQAKPIRRKVSTDSNSISRAEPVNRGEFNPIHTTEVNSRAPKKGLHGIDFLES